MLKSILKNSNSKRSYDEGLHLKEKMQEILLKQSKQHDNQSIKILLVDDDDDYHLLISDALQRSFKHYHLDWKQNGAEARDYLNYLYKHNVNQLPDLILLDLNMPKVDGLALLKEIKFDERFKSILVVVLTVSKSPSDIELAYDLGADSYIIKSSRFSQIVKSMDSLAKFWFETAIRPRARKARLMCA